MRLETTDLTLNWLRCFSGASARHRRRSRYCLARSRRVCGRQVRRISRCDTCSPSRRMAHRSRPQIAEQLQKRCTCKRCTCDELTNVQQKRSPFIKFPPSFPAANPFFRQISNLVIVRGKSTGTIAIFSGAVGATNGATNGATIGATNGAAQLTGNRSPDAAPNARLVPVWLG